jgi:Leucine-rich repeat (LRR) protein
MMRFVRAYFMTNKTSKLKIIIPVSIIFLIIIAALFVSFLKWKPISNPADEEEILYAAAKQLNKNPDDFTEEDFTKITELSLGAEGPTADRGIVYNHIELSNLNFLRKFTNLKKLSLIGIQYPKSAIPKWMVILARYRVFDLNEKYALDLSPLKELSQLQELELVFVPIRNIKPLSSLTNLQRLRISETITYTQISNMQTEEGTVEPGIYVDDTRYVLDLSPLRKLSNLRELHIWGTLIKNLKPLSSLTNLKTLYICSIPISNIKPISKLVNLQELKLAYTKVSGIEPLSGLINLQNLNLTFTNISDLKPLSGLINLHDLDIYYTDVTDLGAIKDLKNLSNIRIYWGQEKKLTKNEIEELQKALPKLKISF